MSVVTASYLVETRPAGSWVALAASDVLDVSGVAEGGGAIDNGMASGADSSQRVTVRVRRSALSTVADKLRIRVTFTINNGTAYTAKAFVGIVVGVTWEHYADAWSLDCEGIQTLLQTVRAFSPMFLRTPIARKSTASSPTSPTNAAVSPLEWFFLTAGGWPAPRDFENPSALFYYDLDEALFTPEAAWFAGEDGWRECLNLVKAAGGQLYLGSDGVLRYRQPLAFGDVSATVTIADSGTPSATRTLYERLDYSRSDRRIPKRVRCIYQERRIMPPQDVVENTTSLFVPGNEAVTITLEPDLPLYSVETATGLIPIVPGGSATLTNLKADTMHILRGDGAPVAQGAGGYTHSLSVTAQRLVLTITNASASPFVFYRVALRGQPVAPAATGSVVVGSGGDSAETLSIEDNAYIQRAGHAEGLASLYLDFYGSARPTYTAAGCLYNPDLDIGDAVLLTNVPLGLSAVRCVIVGISHSATGVRADYSLVRVDDLPKSSNFITVGSTVYAGTGKTPGY